LRQCPASNDADNEGKRLGKEKRQVLAKIIMKQKSHSYSKLTLLVLVASTSIAFADQAPNLPASPESTSFKKPAWLADLSLGIKESYDDNVYLSGVDRKDLPKYKVPAGGVAALNDRSSWVTTVSPKIGFNFAPLFDTKYLEQFTLAYAPDFVIYHDQSTESYNANRFLTAIKGSDKWFSYALDNAFNYIDGSDKGPTYPGSLCSAYVQSTVRERREQIQDRAKLSFRFDTDHWFFRPIAFLTYYDLMTAIIDPSKAGGYYNYADRYDVNGGLDVGYKLNKQFAFTLGYRYGHQYQQQFSFSPDSSPSDYQRVLVGFEGKIFPWLKMDFQIGPDFRSYAKDTATHVTPVNDNDLVTYYGEANVVADLSSKDTLSFKYKQFQWVSSTGKVPYFDSTYDLSYHRKVTEKLGLDLGARILSSDYNSGNLPTCKRDDIQYTFSLGLGYAISSHCSVSASYATDLGRNAEDNVTKPGNREFIRNVISLGAVFKF